MKNKLASILRYHFQDDRDAIVDWLNCPFIEFNGKTPNDLMKENKYTTVLYFANRHLTGEIYDRGRRSQETD